VTFPDERAAHAFVRDFLVARGWAFAEQYDTGAGRIDFALLVDNRPWLGIEVKRDIDETTCASRLADYLEQAQGYSADLGVPVLLGPAMCDIQHGPKRLHLGGSRLTALAALVIYGGRSNVGVLAFHATNPEEMAGMVLRGQVFYTRSARRGEWWSDQVEGVLRMVRSRNSSKVRA
jgi:hypothetical protein